MTMHRFRLVLAICLACLSLLAQAATCDDPRPLRFAQVPIKNSELITSQYRALYEHLEKTLGRRIEVIRAPSYAAVVEGLLANNIDVAELGPASYATAVQRKAAIEPFAAMAERNGVLFDTSKGYYSVLIVRADRNFPSLASLLGASVSLVDPTSTSGALYPRRMIQSVSGMSLERYFGQASYAGSHDRAIDAVVKNVVDAAFVSSLRVDEQIRLGAVKQDELRILWQSSPIPFDPIVMRTALCKPLAKRIRAAFLDSPEELKPFLAEFGRSGFIPVTEEAYREVREILSTYNR